MTPLRYPAGSEARRVAVEAELLRTLAAGAKRPALADLLGNIADRLAASAVRIARMERALDEIVADAMEQDPPPSPAVTLLRQIAANPGRICPPWEPAP